MKFHLLNRYANLSRFSKYTLLALALSIFVLGAKLASSSAGAQKKSFRIAEAITKSADGKTITAKPGFELIKQGENGVVARKKDVDIKSEDIVECTCFEFSRCRPNGPKPCCNHPQDSEGRTGAVGCRGSSDGPSATCKGNCDQCKWK